MFITFEGIDFCGKSTQVRLLKEYFEKAGREVLLIREPGGTAISEKIRTVLLDKKNFKMTNETEILLFSASRAQLVREVIKPSLEKGCVVISDRFFDSTTAYQGYGRGLDLEFVKSLNLFAVGNNLPRISIILDLTITEMIKRQAVQKNSLDRMEVSDKDFFERVRQGYLQMALEDKRFSVIDASMPIDVIHNRIINSINSLNNS